MTPLIRPPLYGSNESQGMMSWFQEVWQRLMQQSRLQLGTEVDTTSGTTVTIASNIPNWVRRITVMLEGVTTTGTSQVLLQLGDSGGFETTGYISTSVVVQNAAATAGAVYTTGFGTRWAAAANTRHGKYILDLKNEVNNTWSCSSLTMEDGTASMELGAGSKSLSGKLTQLRLTTVGGTDTFDAGSVNILYE